MIRKHIANVCVNPCFLRSHRFSRSCDVKGKLRKNYKTSSRFVFKGRRIHSGHPYVWPELLSVSVNLLLFLGPPALGWDPPSSKGSICKFQLHTCPTQHPVKHTPSRPRGCQGQIGARAASEPRRWKHNISAFTSFLLLPSYWPPPKLQTQTIQAPRPKCGQNPNSLPRDVALALRRTTGTPARAQP